MPVILRTIILAALALVFAGEVAAAEGAQPAAGEWRYEERPIILIDEVIGVVNERPVTRGELLPVVNAQLAALPKELGEEELKEKKNDIWRMVFDEKVSELLLLEVAERENIQVSEDVVRQVVARELEHYEGEEALLRDQFPGSLGRTEDVTIKDYEAVVRTREKMMTAMEQKIGPPRFITPRELGDYYKKNKDRFREQERVQVRRVMIIFKADDARYKSYEEALARARELHKKAVDGTEPFETIAGTWSDGPYRQDGGLMRPTPQSNGWFTRGEVSELLEKTAFSLRPGETSDVIETDLDPGDQQREIFFIRLEGRREAREKSFMEAQDEIKRLIRQEERTTKREQLFKRLRQEAYIDLFGVNMN